MYSGSMRTAAFSGQNVPCFFSLFSFVTVLSNLLFLFIDFNNRCLHTAAFVFNVFFFFFFLISLFTQVYIVNNTRFFQNDLCFCLFSVLFFFFSDFYGLYHNRDLHTGSHSLHHRVHW